MTEINHIQLNDFCLRILENLNSHYSERQNILTTMFNTGVRVNEVLNVNLWSVYDSNNMQLTTSKSGEIRIINNSLIENSILLKYINNENNFIFTYDMLVNDLKKLPYRIIFNGNKNNSLIHVFRYNYIKKLFFGGLSVADVQNNLGHKKFATTNYYINAPIYLNELR